MMKRGKRRVNCILPVRACPTCSSDPDPALAVAAWAFLSVLMQVHAIAVWSVAMQRVSGFERQFSSDFDHGDAAVNGVDVDNSNSAGEGRDFVNQVFVGFGNDDCRMSNAPVVGHPAIIIAESDED